MIINPTLMLSEYKDYPDQIMNYIIDKTGLVLKFMYSADYTPARAISAYTSGGIPAEPKGNRSLGLVDSAGYLQMSLDYFYYKFDGTYFIWKNEADINSRFVCAQSMTISDIIDDFINTYRKCVERQKEQHYNDIRKAVNQYEL